MAWTKLKQMLRFDKVCSRQTLDLAIAKRLPEMTAEDVPIGTMSALISVANAMAAASP